MHVGNLRTALYEYLIAKSQGGKFILRIEDTDQERLVDGAVEVIYRTLDMVGLKHDEGPDVGGEYGPYVQSQRKDMYKPYAEQLVKEGKAYYCFCTKERLDALHQEQGVGGGYDRHCRDLPQEEVDRLLAQGVPYVIRQKMPLEGSTTFQDAVYGEITVENKELEDQILLKADGYPTYNFANVIDDHSMHITHVVRGCEYLSSAPKYNLLYEAFGWEVPTYVHLPLIMGKNEDGSVSKLSKRHGATSFEDLMADGYLPEAVINFLALLGWNPGTDQEIMSLDELVELFDITKCSKAGAKFDYVKGLWFNREYILMKDNKELAPAFDKILRENGIEAPMERVEAVVGMMKMKKINFIKELWPLCDFFFIAPEAYDREDKFVRKNWTETAAADMTELAALLEGLDDFSVEGQKAAVDRWAEETGKKPWNPWRVALVGTGKGPDMYELSAFLGKEETLRRMRKAVEILK